MLASVFVLGTLIQVSSDLVSQGRPIPIAAPTQILDLSRQTWCAGSSEIGVFVLDPATGLTLYSLDRNKPETTTRNVSAAGTVVEKRTTTVSAPLAARRRWTLPQGLLREELPVFVLAPWRKDAVWVVDASEGRLYRLTGDEWAAPIDLKNRISGAVALSDGRLVVCTPEHPSAPFAVVRLDGTIERRFGDRRSAPLGQLLPFHNTWRLVSLVGGDIVAAHGYFNLVRRYSPDGQLVWERSLKVPEAERLEGERKRVEERYLMAPSSCCVRADVVAFATRILRADGDRVLVQLGASPALHAIDERGEGIGTIGLGIGDSIDGWKSAGCAWLGEKLVALERRGIVTYGISPRGGTLTGRIVTRDGEGLGSASIMVHTPGGLDRTALSDATGSFSIHGASPGSTGELAVAAEGFMEVHATGVLVELLAKPIVLERRPQLCVTVRSGATREPIRQFAFSLLRNLQTGETVGLEAGPTQEFSNLDGKACLNAPFAGPWLLRVKARGYATSELRLTEPSDSEALLEKEAVLEATTTDDAGTPVEATVVTLEPVERERRTARALPDDLVGRSDIEGHARVGGLRPAAYRLTAMKEGFLPVAREVSLNEGPNALGLKLPRGTRVLVHVVSQDQTPIADARVEVGVRGRTVPRIPKCVTDSAGACVAEGVPAGAASVFAEAAGRAPSRSTVVIGPEDREVPVEVVLKNGIRVDGTVDGREAYPETALMVSASSVGVPVMTARVGADGRFVLHDVPPGPLATWVKTGSAKTTLAFERLEIPAGRPVHEVRLRIQAATRISGRVFLSGAGCGSCQVTASRVGVDVGRPEVSGATSPDGLYSLQLPGTGRYRLEAREPRGTARRAETVEVEGDTSVDLNLGDDSLSGRVLLASRRPAAGARVSAVDSVGGTTETVADELGQFRIAGLVGGRQHLTARLRGAATTRDVDFSPGQTSVELVLPEASGMRLLLRDAETGQPVARSSVRVVSGSGDSVLHSDVLADEDGMTAVAGTGSGPFTVVIAAGGYALRTLRQVPASGPEIQVPLFWRFRGFTVDISGGSASPCSFELRDRSGLPIALGIEYLPGPVPLSVRKAFFNQLEAGEYAAILRFCDGKSATAPVLLAPGESPVVRF